MKKEGENRTGIRKKSRKRQKGDREQKRKQEKIGQTEKNRLKRPRKERKTSTIERKTNQDITTPEGKTEEKKISYVAEFQKKEQKKKTERCSCYLHDQQDLCWGELISRDTSEELKNHISMTVKI